MKNISKNFGIALIAGLLSMGAVTVSYAAENAAGVSAFAEKTADSAKKALEDLQGGRVDEGRAELKNVRQYSKEITGDAAGMSLQKANQAVKETIRVLDEEKDVKKAIEVLTPAVKSLQEISAAAKKK